MKSKITYPIHEEPEYGELIEVVTNVFWLRMPMPFKLDHINIWLIEDEEHWTVIDSGLMLEKCKILWQKIINKHLKNKPIKQVICTHLHPDHIGLAGWLCEQYNAQLWMSKSEYDLYQHLLSIINNQDYSKAHDFYKERGLEENQLEYYDHHIGQFKKFVYPLPLSFKILAFDDILLLGGHSWQVVIGSGHSPEHVCLWCKTLGIFISGDQLLPTISSNISVYPESANHNPLNDWLEACKNIKHLLDNNVLVLPAHGLPFHGATIRFEQQISDIEQDLAALEKFCLKPFRMIDAFPVLFKMPMLKQNLILASGECQAHLNYLIVQDKLVIQRDANNVIWYKVK